MKYLVFTGLLFVGCAGSPAAIATLSAERLRSQDSPSLCNAYHINGQARVRQELERRGEINAAEWADIDQHTISIGMSEIAVLCSWGWPGVDGAVNESVNSYGVSKQLVYRACRTCKARYIYTRNGKVTSWQS